MAKPFLIFTSCGIVGVCAAVADLLNLEVAHGLLGIAFYLLLFLGFLSVHRLWNNVGR